MLTAARTYNDASDPDTDPEKRNSSSNSTPTPARATLRSTGTVHSPVSTHDPYPNPSSRSRLNIRNIVSSHLHSLATSSAQRSSCRHTPSSHTRLNPSRAHARTRAHPRRAVLAALVASCPTAGRHANSASCQHSKRNSTHVHVHQNVGNQAGHFVLGPRTGSAPHSAPHSASHHLSSSHHAA
jgi:hypothetical protein